jgi:hypothetical protein
VLTLWPAANRLDASKSRRAQVLKYRLRIAYPSYANEFRERISDFRLAQLEATYDLMDVLWRGGRFSTVENHL